MDLAFPLRALAPAKLNLCLYVGRRRQDGLHEVCSIFQPITLADELTMDEASGSADEVVCPGVEEPNLAAEALARFRERFDWRGPAVRLQIDKRIPVASGLGGGSADAAAALRLARKASGINAPSTDLAELALSLGADVPSQLEPMSALVTGAGEWAERLPPLDMSAVLLTGVGALSTAAVYARADERGEVRDDLDRKEHELRAARAFAGSDPFALEPLLRNDLEPAAIELEPAAARALEMLHDAGARVARVTGSGPAAFGLFQDRAEAEAAASSLSATWSGSATFAASFSGIGQ